jgi:heme a synthase
MDYQALLRLFSRISLGCIFLVIIAGSFVRVTGSGMGCPDWPKCFGYLIPPTEKETLTFKEGKSFEKNQMVILNDTLWVANHDLMCGKVFNHSDWHKYPKHNYAIFNPFHTWVEFINRLATVLLGIPCFILFILSFLNWRKNKDFITFLLAGASMLTLAFEAWLGKLVVDGDLKENSITYHMIGSLALIGFLLMAIVRLSENKTPGVHAKSDRLWIYGLLILSFIQVILGTQVREEIDVFNKSSMPRDLWIDSLSFMFKIHRSFSLAIILSVFMIWKKFRHVAELSGPAKAIILVTLLEAIAGVVLAYFDMPAFLQPVHLFFGVMLFTLALYPIMILSTRHSTNSLS